jgi:hypothetical protein
LDAPDESKIRKEAAHGGSINVGLAIGVDVVTTDRSGARAVAETTLRRHAGCLDRLRHIVCVQIGVAAVNGLRRPG